MLVAVDRPANPGSSVRKIHTSPSLIEIAHLRNLLETEGIACQIRNERLAGVAGEIPFVECWPELWVQRPGEALRARALIDIALRPAPAPEPWNCPGCGERIEGQFTSCWNCGADAEGSIPT
jgi:Putative prokaryotic signal transducing protein